MSDPPSAMFLVIDQLPSAWLGPYGNTTIETDNFNLLAADSLLFDFAFADSLDLHQSLNLLWGWGANRGTGQADFCPAFFSTLQAADVETVLLTDDPAVAHHPQAKFDEIVFIEQPTPLTAAAQVADTQLAFFFAQVAAWLESEARPGQLCWVHSRGFAGPWDAPYPLRQHFAGEDDPDPPRFLELASLDLAAEIDDPDQQLGLQQAAAAQVTVLDQCLGMLAQVLNQSFDQKNFLLALSSLRGCGLGEHGNVGLTGHLHAEMMQIPLMIRFPQHLNHKWPVGRSSRFTSPAEITSLFALWLTEQEDAMKVCLTDLDRILPDRRHELKLLANPRQQMIQTHAWKLLRDSQGTIELYTKPDDRWEINDVANRCPEIVEQLLVWLDRVQVGEKRQQSFDSISSHAQLPDSLTVRRD